MQSKSSGGLIGSVLKQLKRLAFTLTEKPSTAVEQYTLEHFLLYHGLVGSTPDSQPAFRDVRADIIEAVDARSPLNLGIALKLPPLWWEDKLCSIFAELKAKDRQLIVDMLLPADESGQELPAEHNPLMSANWQVRANAANVLCFLEVTEAVPRMVQSLEETSEGELKAAFCHIAFALGRLSGDEARRALVKYLHNEEPWFRVDAARALSLWPLDAVAEDLAEAALSHHNLSDYVSVAIARNQSPLRFLQHSERICQEAGLEMAIEIVRASTQTYPPEIVFETGVHLCWPELRRLAVSDPTPRRVRATLALADCFTRNAADLEDSLAQAETSGIDGTRGSETAALSAEELVAQAAEVSVHLSAQAIGPLLIECLNKFEPDQADRLDDTRHAVWLAGRLGIAESNARLVGLLRAHLSYSDDIIEALGLLGDPRAAEQLVLLAKETVDLDERKSRPASLQPVEEEEPEKARHYWSILKALGHIPHPKGIELLIEATEDFAPDKRQQALESLVTAYKCQPGQSVKKSVHDSVERGLTDPSAQMRMTALDGVSRLEIIDLLPKVLKLVDAKEVSVSRKSLTVMSELADSGHKNAVANAVESKLKGEFDRNKKDRLQHFLDGLH